jgi:hypothetical protein
MSPVRRESCFENRDDSGKTTVGPTKKSELRIHERCKTGPGDNLAFCGDGIERGVGPEDALCDPHSTAPPYGTAIGSRNRVGDCQGRIIYRARRGLVRKGQSGSTCWGGRADAVAIVYRACPPI